MNDDRNNATVSRVNPDESKSDSERSGNSGSGNEDSEKDRDKNGGSDSNSNGDKKDDKDKNKKDKKGEGGNKKGSGVHDDEDKDKGKGKDKDESKRSKMVQAEEQKRKLMMRLHQIHMASQAATAGAKFLITAKIISMLKMLLQMAVAIAQAASQLTLGTLLMMFGQMAVQFIGNCLAALAGFLGTTVTTAATVVVSFICAIAVLVSTVVGSVVNNSSTKDSLYECNTDRSFMSGSGDLTATAEELETAKTAYAVLKAYGLADTNIAGVFGNWSCESSMDPTGVETIYSEPRIIPAEGTKKWEAWKGTYEYAYEDPHTAQMVTTEVSPANFLLSETTPYGKFGLRTYVGTLLSRTTLRNYSDKYPAIHYMGIGLGQWTNGRNLKLIAYADAHDGYEWYDLELQLMFMIDPNGDDISYVNKLAGWNDETSASEAAEWFCHNWEGITCTQERKDKAEAWYTTISSWQEGIDYDLAAAQTLVASVAAAGHAGANSTGANALRSCSGYVRFGNDNAAMAALAYAWGPGDAYANDGTECWKQIFEAIVGDEYYRSCDRTVAVAIKWSGTDSDYPNGSTRDQLVYLLASPRWDRVDWGGNPANLMPGDVLIRNDNVIDLGGDVGHTLMYVGVDNVVARFGEEYNGINIRERGYCFVSGSINSYSPHVQVFTKTSGANDLTTYYAFRNNTRYNNHPEWSSLACVGESSTAT